MLERLFVPMQFSDDLPDAFPSPFDVVPHAVAQQAAELLKVNLPQLDSYHRFDQPGGGKMFGVLVVRDGSGHTGYLAAFSGMLGNLWHHQGYVPPVFDLPARESLLLKGEADIAELTRQIDALESDVSYRCAFATLENYRTTAKNRFETVKGLMAEKKKSRHQLRQGKNLTDLQLRVLANESRDDKLELKKLKILIAAEEQKPLSDFNAFQEKIDHLKRQRKRLSARLQKALFDGYQLLSVDGQRASIGEFFQQGLPPSGAGDCAATKLLHFANQNKLVPVALAEFWWGAAPINGLRTHGRYYPSCRSRCRVILPFMLSGLTVTVPLHERAVELSDQYPITLYEDDDIVVVEKPAGLLSVPGKVITDSVETRIKARNPHVTGVMLLHRLDQATSGVMVAAKHASAYASLQHQFQDRTIEKKYIAVLDGVLDQDHGEVSLPLRLDIYDRPRQIVCKLRGKASLTRFTVIDRHQQTTRVAFYPHTGRTHQLRVHAAHPEGLNLPILGDELYGNPAERLHLHAWQIALTHPVTGKRMEFTSEVPF